MPHNNNQRRWRTIPLSVMLPIVVAAFVGLTTILTLFIVLTTTSGTTRSLLASNGHWLLSTIEADIKNQFTPVHTQLQFLVAGVGRGQVNPSKRDEFISLMKGAVAAAPQVRVLSFTATDGRMVGVTQGPYGVFSFDDWIRSDEERQEIVDAQTKREAVWGPVYFVPAEGVKTSVANLRQSAFVGDKFIGVFSATITVDALSTHLKELSGTLEGFTPFILYGRDRVLAHPGIVDKKPLLSAESPLPGLDAIGDPFVQGLWTTGETIDFGDLQASLVRSGNEERVVAYRESKASTPVPLIIGVVMPMDVLDSISALISAGLWSFGLMLVAIIISVLVSRLIVRPLRMMAHQSRAVAKLDFSSVEVLPKSRFSELNEQADAFNNMLTGLRWLEAYVPKPLVRRLLQSGGGQKMESEERILTVMFADIVGFTVMCEKLSATEVASLLNSYFDLIGSCIDAQGGTIDKYMGDGLMAFWGAPEDQPDHADRALRSIEQIERALHQRNLTRHESGEANLKVRIGIHSGPAVVGNIGMRGRLGYTIVGDTVNVGSRLEQLGKTIEPARDLTVLISASTRNYLSVPVDELKPLGPHSVPGREESVDVYLYEPG
ncbi:adenylate/guanylate cyclase domain-containing protein [Phyllobacterium sp. YR531]|uniref:adenylate/guanylate cyclase domain-containing protein n=1 Tax=Phyllobacterium sp. YR531 TaxID=1144343 RepID=UPI00138ABB1C|nr:adenylate/guanylate cyclase domain-containing protein [Phyllobacterium sp. YR531]